MPPNRSATPTLASATRLGERRVRIERKVARVRKRLDEPRARCDHRRVVGAELQRDESRVGERRAELGIRRDSADDRDAWQVGRLRRLAEAADERLHDRALVRGGEIRRAALGLLRPELACGVQQRGLESREREVETRYARHGEVECTRIALLRETVDRCPAGIAETEKPCALVE